MQVRRVVSIPISRLVSISVFISISISIPLQIPDACLGLNHREINTVSEPTMTSFAWPALCTLLQLFTSDDCFRTVMTGDVHEARY